MSSELRRAKARYLAASEVATREAAKTVSADTGVSVHVTGWTRKAQDAYTTQWLPYPRHAEGDFDWPEIFRRYGNEPGCLQLAMWHEDRLCGLMLATLTGQAVRIEFMERDSGPDCPLEGAIIPLCLESATKYAQELGRRELRLHSVRSALVPLYVSLGYVEVSPRGETSYLKKDV